MSHQVGQRQDLPPGFGNELEVGTFILAGRGVVNHDAFATHDTEPILMHQDVAMGAMLAPLCWWNHGIPATQYIYVNILKFNTSSAQQHIQHICESLYATY